MGDNIYVQIAKEVGRDVRLVRKVTHHPFDFFSRVMADVNDHRPVRFRYLGVFPTKDYWRKGMTKGIPPEGGPIYAKAPEVKFDKIYINLKEGNVENSRFLSTDGCVNCDSALIEWWRPKIINTDS
jgi:hypothetical protein